MSAATTVDPFLQSLFPQGGETLSRNDAGVDAGVPSGRSIGALAPGTIVGVQHYSGFGETIFEQLAAPIAGKDFVYYALETGGKWNQRVGPVKAGTPIASGTGGGIEVGPSSSADVTGIDQQHIAAGDRTRSGEEFARAIGLNPGAPESNVTVAPASKSFLDKALSAIGGTALPGVGFSFNQLGEATGEASNLLGIHIPTSGDIAKGVAGDIVNWVKKPALEVLLYGVFILGGMALVIYGVATMLRPRPPGLRELGKAAVTRAAVAA